MKKLHAVAFRAVAWPVGVLSGCLLSSTAMAADSGPVLDLTSTWPGLLALVIFIGAYLLVATEEYTDLRKSTPVVLAAGLIWLLIAGYVRFTGLDAPVEQALVETFTNFASLFLFLLVAMAYVNAMTDRHVFEVLRGWLVARRFTYRQLFWITGFLSFFMSSAIDNLTTALVMGTVVMVVGGGSRRFVTLACINVVVSANAGGAFSPFGDITTLMVWQTGILDFVRFFRLFVPALANFVVPAAIMYFAVPADAPEAGSQVPHMRRGGRAVIALFALTVATAVLGHGVLGLPPYFGMMVGLAYLQLLMFYLRKTAPARAPVMDPSADLVPAMEIDERGERKPASRFSVLVHVANVEWDTLLFFYGVLLCIGGLAFLGYLTVLAKVLYLQWGATWADITVGVLSAVIDNIPIMAAVVKMNPSMPDGQWLLVTLTAGVGGSLLSVGSAAGVALMGQARGAYTFMSHMKWSWAVALGYVASILAHLAINANLF